MKKKLTGWLLAAVLLLSCRAPALAEGFKPALDTETACQIRVVGTYNNFESLEAEFDRFNEYYPNVEMSFTKLDDYAGVIALALISDEAPNIFCSSAWMIGSEKYEEMFSMAENLADPALNLDLSCIQDGLLYWNDQGEAPLIPVFCNTFGMLVNMEIFTKCGLRVPTTYSELLSVCEALKQAGYASPIMGYNSESYLIYSFAYPHYMAYLQEHPELVSRLNALEPGSADFMRPTLEMVQDFMSRGYVDLEACGEIKDNYSAVLLRFLEGDVPMMAVSADTSSGSKKREAQSEAFSAHPFDYRFYLIPTTEAGGYFVNVASLQFSVNTHCQNLDMTNEFMRFLISTEELNEIAQAKRLVTVSKDMSFDKVFASLGSVPSDRVIMERDVALLDEANIQLRRMAYQVANGLMTVDEALAAFGTL